MDRTTRQVTRPHNRGLAKHPRDEAPGWSEGPGSTDEQACHPTRLDGGRIPLKPKFRRHALHRPCLVGWLVRGAQRCGLELIFQLVKSLWYLEALEVEGQLGTGCRWRRLSD